MGRPAKSLATREAIFAVMVPETRTVEQQYTVSVPEWREEKRQRNFMVPEAMARVMSVAACEPELPPVEMHNGTNRLQRPQADFLGGYRLAKFKS